MLRLNMDVGAVAAVAAATVAVVVATAVVAVAAVEGVALVAAALDAPLTTETWCQAAEEFLRRTLSTRMCTTCITSTISSNATTCTFASTLSLAVQTAKTALAAERSLHAFA